MTLLTTTATSNTTTNISTTSSSQNICQPDSRSRLVTLDPAFMTYYLGSLALVVAVNVTGNFLVLRTMCRHRCLWIPSNVLICSLGVSDLLFGPIFLVYNVAGVNSLGIKDVFGDWSVCRVLLMEVLALEICSAYMLVAITATRYIGSEYALHFNQYVTFRTCVITVVVTWVISHTASIIVYVARVPHHVSTGAYCRVCRYEAIYTVQELSLLTTFQFALPFTLMLLFYVKMICTARTLNKRVMSLSFCSNDMGSQRSRTVIGQRRQRSIVIISLLIGCFALSYVPMITYFFLVIVARQSHTDYEYLSATSRIFLALNTAINVFIYAGRMCDFRYFLRKDLTPACTFLAKCGKGLVSSTKRTKKRSPSRAICSIVRVSYPCGPRLDRIYREGTTEL